MGWARGRGATTTQFCLRVGGGSTAWEAVGSGWGSTGWGGRAAGLVWVRVARTTEFCRLGGIAFIESHGDTVGGAGPSQGVCGCLVSFGFLYSRDIWPRCLAPRRVISRTVATFRVFSPPCNAQVFAVRSPHHGVFPGAPRSRPRLQRAPNKLCRPEARKKRETHEAWHRLTPAGRKVRRR